MRGRNVVRCCVLLALTGTALPALSSATVSAQLATATSAYTRPAECADWARTTCLLPFPNGRAEVRESDSQGSGYRLSVLPGNMDPAIERQLGPGARPSEIASTVDGYSAVTPISFETFGPFDPASLPADGGDVLVLVELSTGRRVPLRVQVNHDAARIDASGDNTVVTAWPRDRLEPSTRYVAVLTDQLRGRRGATLARARGLDANSQYANSLRADIVAAGFDPSTLLNATTFRTRSRANVVGEVERLAELVRSDDHPVRNVRSWPGFGGWATTVTGMVRLTDFRDRDGVIRDGTGIQRHTWVKFVLTLPNRPATPAGAPVQVYGHGLSVFKETVFIVAGENAKKGVATIAIDVPNHGDRIGDGGYLITNATPSALGRTASMVLQGELDSLSLVLAIQNHLSTLDAHPKRLFGRSGDRVADLDTTRLLYAGTSMGSVLGAQALWLAPEISAGFLQVGGVGIVDIISNSLLWEVFRSTVPKGASPGDRVGLVGLASLLFDRSDASWTAGELAASDTNVFLQVALDDGVVGNTASERLIRLMGLRPYGPLLRPIVDLPAGRPPTMPTDSFGQVAQDEHPKLLRPLLAHVGFSDPDAVRTYRIWLDQVLAQPRS